MMRRTGKRFAMLLFSVSIVLLGFANHASADDFVKTVGDGIQLSYESITVKEGYLYVRYMIVSNKDTMITVNAQASEIYDPFGREFTPANNIYVVQIGNINRMEREIIENVPTPISIEYAVGGDYKLPESFAKITITVNGKKVEFRNVPSTLG